MITGVLFCISHAMLAQPTFAPREHMSTLAFMRSDGDLLATKESGANDIVLWKLDKQLTKVKRYSPNVDGSVTSILVDAKTNRLLFTESNRVYSIDLSSGKIDKLFELAGSNRIRLPTIGRSDNAVYLFSDDSILEFDAKFSKRHVVLKGAQNLILTLSIADNGERFFYSDSKNHIHFLSKNRDHDVADKAHNRGVLGVVAMPEGAVSVDIIGNIIYWDKRLQELGRHKIRDNVSAITSYQQGAIITAFDGNYFVSRGHSKELLKGNVGYPICRIACERNICYFGIGNPFRPPDKSSRDGSIMWSEIPMKTKE